MSTFRNRDAAYAGVNIGARQQEVIDILSVHPEGLTNYEIAQLYFDGKVNRVTPRIKELRDLEVVVRAGDKFNEDTGKNNALWSLRED